LEKKKVIICDDYVIPNTIGMTKEHT